MFLRMIYDEKLAQAAYLIGCQKTGEAIVIDPERDVDRYIDLAREHNLRLVAAAETHIHADFLSGARELAERIGAHVYVSNEGDADWKYQWLDKRIDGGSYKHTLLHDGDTFSIGNIDFRVMHTPGHTPEHIVFLVTDRGGGATEPIGMASGDFLFVGDLGRPDLLESAAGQAGAMKPSAQRLYSTVGKLDDLPDYMQVWPAHGAGSACGKALGAVPTSTIGYEKRFNSALRAADSESHFVDFILADQPEPPLYFANMKQDNKLGPRVLGGLPNPKTMSLNQLAEIDAKFAAIVDARTWEEFVSGHIPGSLSIPMSNTFNTDAGSFVRDKETIYLVTTEEQREEAIRDLIRVGLDRIKGWVNADEFRTPPTGVSLDTIEEVDAPDARRVIKDTDVHVLDVRRATEYAQGHIPDALNIAHTRLASRLESVPKRNRWLVHCRSGARSARSSAFLKRMGYDVVNLRGGIVAWEKAGGPTE